MSHLHHIVPIHAGGTDDPSNLIELTVEEHAEAHRILWETHGRWQDRLAWKGLAGMITKEEIIRQIQIESWKNPDRRAAVKSQWTPERRERHKAFMNTPEMRAKKSAAATLSRAMNPRPKKERKSRVTGVGSGNHSNHVPSKQKDFIIDGVRITNLRKWADSMNYNAGSVRQMAWKTGVYKGHKIQVAS